MRDPDYDSGPIEKDKASTLNGRGFVYGFRQRGSHAHQVYSIDAKSYKGLVYIQVHSQRSKNNNHQGGTIMTLTKPEARHLLRALEKVERPRMLVERMTGEPS